MFICRLTNTYFSFRYFFFFFFNDTATTEIYTLSLHDALPILRGRGRGALRAGVPRRLAGRRAGQGRRGRAGAGGRRRPRAPALHEQPGGDRRDRPCRPRPGPGTAAMSTPLAPATKVMVVTIITIESGGCHNHRERPRLPAAWRLR